MSTLPCLACRMPLKSVFQRGSENAPYEGVVCTVRGNYGSKAHDPWLGDTRWVEFNICDNCLVRAGRRGDVTIGTPGETAKPTYEKWGPDDDDEQSSSH